MSRDVVSLQIWARWRLPQSLGPRSYARASGSQAIRLSDGAFTLASGSPIPLGKSLSAIVIADLNGDGKLDLAVTDCGGNAVLILLGNGDGTFGVPTTIPVGNQPDAIVAADFNNDRKLDLAVANYADGTITLLLGNGDGTFTQAAGSPYTVGSGPYQIAAADFNGDGKLDLAVANLTDGTILILLRSSSGVTNKEERHPAEQRKRSRNPRRMATVR